MSSGNTAERIRRPSITSSTSEASASLSIAMLSPPRRTSSSGTTTYPSFSGQGSTGSSYVSPSPGSSSASSRGNASLLIGQASSSLVYRHPTAPRSSSLVTRRRRSSRSSEHQHNDPTSPSSSSPRGSLVDSVAREQSRSARKLNDSMVYLDGPQIYTCAQCRTHLTSHDEIISKSFHGRHGRAYLFDHCVNVRVGPPEDRLLITGLHSVCDIFCKRCKKLVGWTYSKAYENSQKYKEGKFIVEKINLHLEESDYYDLVPPAGERRDRFRARSISWGRDCYRQQGIGDSEETIYEYRPSSPVAASTPSPRRSSR